MASFAGRYAQAFLDVVTAANLDAATTDARMADFVFAWGESPQLREFFLNPSVPSVQKVEFLDKLNAKIGMSKELRNLIAVLIDNDRIGHVAEVEAAYRKLLQEKSGIRHAEIVTARELSAAEKDSLVSELSKMAGAEIEPTFKLDETILGGTVVRIGSTVYDGSVRGRLDRLRTVLSS